MHYSEIDSPMGTVLIVGSEQGLHAVSFQQGSQPLAIAADWQRDDQALCAARTQLQQYFAGQRQQFELALAPVGTEFQRQVWQALCQIPYGTTASYGQIASAIGKPKAVRALGAANGKNPIAVVIPCHRVIGANGSLTGYAGGLELKQQLLQLEQPDLLN
ncbi:methylated-DNA--[protein]-cysteine S-methyltransferase [uncultured Ferrimonas sp.]|uniref:methylated-DNA--[protein]-cysteine S-methyltransferase n=1 Tax=uncultured Ferrimonas sp. TaxID=432640 RepID=UPI002628B43F|nr:methylated-DNA--[protein]-cysteine S-methyltransferase [uncultured Ferrimonas sp.]